MRAWTSFAFALVGLASRAPAQPFGFTHQMLPADADGTMAVALGDVDGDGDLDAFVGNAFGQQNRLYLNGGSGVFTDVTATNLPALIDDTGAVALGDVDGDGDLDAFVGNGLAFGGSGQNRLYLNGGTGVFTDVTATNLPALIDDTGAVA
ncbi:MAG: FG-GAP-like repeat-containing protein, partial [Planctomycetes bacterium]|nr:FG-GAP-like repeat-containing protein [Planctomycetota bacterium]